MNEDPIVAEVRRIRDRQARRFGYDIHKIFADLIERQRTADPLHPLVENAGQWADALTSQGSLTIKEEPPGKD